MVYLAGKVGQFMGKNDRERFDVLQWVMFQMGGLGPMLGQAHHFRIYAPEKVPYAIHRYTQEAQRLYKVLDTRLGESRFLGSPHYSIADIACWPWVASYERQGIQLSDFPHVKRWFNTIAARPAVQRGIAIFSDLRK